MVNDELTRRYVDGIAMAIASRVVALDNRLTSRTAIRISALPTWRLKRTIDYIDAHLSQRILLADMAKAAGHTRMHFAAQFRVATGISPHEYLLQRRIERAQTLLRSSEAPIVDVALEVGFANQTHFSTVFRRLVGESPRRWRRDNGPARRIVPFEMPAALFERPPPIRQ
jgi:AraC-like DNA-binding protein